MRSIILIIYTVLFITLLTACGLLETPIAPPEKTTDFGDLKLTITPVKEIVKPTPFSSPLVSNRFEVSAQVEILAQTIDEIYFNKYGRNLYSNENWWLDYGVDKMNGSDKEYHQYVYLNDRRSYLDPYITVISDDESGGIISVTVTQSDERHSEQTVKTFSDYFYCVIKAFLPDITEDSLGEIFKGLCENENWIDHLAEPYPTALYYTNDMYCYAYFKGGNETICFKTDVSEKLPEYKAGNVKCIEIR